MDAWYQLKSTDAIPTPSLLVYPDRVKQNIEEMVRVAGDVQRLRPHIKTHKCAQIVHLQQAVGIQKYKCATIAEAEMLGRCEAEDVLIAYQPTGPNQQRFLKLIRSFPNTRFSTLVDNEQLALQLNQLAKEQRETVNLFIDLDVGMHRTGIALGAGATKLYHNIRSSSNLLFQGWHVYDGHLRQSDFQERKEAADLGFQKVKDLIADVEIQTIVAGGSPTFSIHALRADVELSPGTTLLWDQGYGQNFTDLKFLPAALVITRVISKPAKGLMCLDLGHKAIASEMPHPRVHLLGLEGIVFETHSEEHLVVRTNDVSKYQVGDVIFGIPQHICPTSALHQEMLVVENREVVHRWPVGARDRRLEI